MNKYLPFILLGLIMSAIVGTLCDVWSHVMNKVETFWTPSHAVIYFSVALMGILVLATVIHKSVEMGSFSPRKMKNVKGYALIGTGSLIQLISGVSDEIYHSIMGFDVTMWSPPHIGAVFAAVLICLGIFELLKDEEGLRKWVGSVLALALSIVIMQLSVIEYDVYTSAFGTSFALDNRWGPYSYFLSILLTPVVIYSFVLGYKRFMRPVGTLITSIVFLINITTFVIWNASPVDLRFPLLLFIAGIMFDVVIFMKREDKGLYLASMAAVIGIVIAQEVQNPLKVDMLHIFYAFVGSILLAVLFTYLAIQKTNAEGYHRLKAASIMLCATILLTPGVSFAHDGTIEKIAPDLHPLIVLIEFLIIFFVGYAIAQRLTKIDMSKN